MSAIEDLRHTIARLRGPGGCPWDQEQTHATLVRCLIDEASELIDTIDRRDMPHMREELGDVLIQVVFHAQLAEEAGHFNLEDVAREVNEKLIRRQWTSSLAPFSLTAQSLGPSNRSPSFSSLTGTVRGATTGGGAGGVST